VVSAVVRISNAIGSSACGSFPPTSSKYPARIDRTTSRAVSIASSNSGSIFFDAFTPIFPGLLPTTK
jgi:hypothetical protein